MRLTPPNIKLTATCNVCKQEEEVTPYVHKLLSSGRSFTCSACRNGSQQWSRATYQEYLKSDHWQSFRKRVLNHYGRKCYLCNRADGQIDIHHNNYDRLGCELMSDVIPLCHEHHKMFEGVA